MAPAGTCPLAHTRTIDRYFLEHRAKVIDIAAFLDRIDRSQPPDNGREDFRLVAFRRTLEILTDGRGDRAKRVLEMLSDHSVEPIERAPMQGAFGAVPPPSHTGAAGKGGGR
ncbi:MAG: hypothetical protein KF817_06975 [Phycisphaeraceae bacterium]|nr:hypothetical protein [Phycisphaeraceae bacterium]